MQAKSRRRQKPKIPQARPTVPRSDARSRAIDPTDLSDLPIESLVESLAEADERLGCAVRFCDARDSLTTVFLDLPPLCRDHVLEENAPAPREGHRWAFERLESCFDRLAAFEEKHRDAEISRALVTARQIKTRMNRARDDLILANLRIVPHIAKGYATGVVPFVDMVQDGYLGLLQAVDRFDPNRGFKFSTYAAWWIRKALNDAFRCHARLIRLPENVRRELGQLRKVSQELRESLGRWPTDRELAERMKLSFKRVKKLLDVGPDLYAIEDLPAYRDAGWEAIVRDTAVPDPLESTLRSELRDRVEKALQVLSPRERKIVRLRFGFDTDGVVTLLQVAQRFGLSRERVRQIETTALKKMNRLAKHRLPVK
jgi:RNA polymerase primary sigma factor